MNGRTGASLLDEAISFRGSEISKRELLLEIFDKFFNWEELRVFCFRLGVDYDDLPGSTKIGKSVELISYLERRRRVPDLIQKGKNLRSDIYWDILMLPSSTGGNPLSAFTRQLPNMSMNKFEFYLGESRMRLIIDVSRESLRDEKFRATVFSLLGQFMPSQSDFMNECRRQC